MMSTMGSRSGVERLLVVGANGYVGRPLYERARSCFDVSGTSSTGAGGLLPLRLESAGEFDYQQVDSSTAVLLTAAISAPDVCAREFDFAWAINVTATSEFITRVLDRGARVIFFSSDAVYGERPDAFDEQAICSPMGEYAVMKHEVEQRFAEEPFFKTIRLSYVFSSDDKFTKYLAGCAQRNEEAELFHPFFRAIVHRGDVVDGALALAQRWNEFPQRIINFGGPDILSRVDFAECLKKSYLSELRYRITEPDEEFFRNRPRTIAMKSVVLPQLLGRSTRSLVDAAKLEFRDRANSV